MFAVKKNERAHSDIMNINDFRMFLHVERARADREGPSFSLVLFEINEIYTNKYINEFTRLIKGRIRIADCAGWFNSGTIGIILYATGMAGAGKFILDIEKQTGTILPAYTIFSYPDHWMAQDDIPDTHSFMVHPYQKQTGEKVVSSGQVIDQVKDSFVTPVPLWKRLVDIIGSLAGLILLSPLLLLTALYIKIVSPGPVFFTQQRVGYKGKLFTFFKFRTMNVNNDISQHKAYLKNLIGNDTPMVKLDTQKKDPRIIPGGEILRKTCIDELPQLLNVLRGDMSLIGPRPCIRYEANEFAPWHHQRFNILPGMTGLWQVSGKNSLSFKEMVRLDISYGERMSFFRDVKILLLTVPTILGLIFDKLNRKLSRRKTDRQPFRKGRKKILDFMPLKSVYRGEYVKDRRKQSI
jgi:lipopolysaccharide/colanic/teichoic acid biosynthesis glycosyltransferase